MGASASKTAGAAARQYPKRPPPTSSPSAVTRNAPSPAAPTTQPGPTVRPPPRASTTRDAGINADASDPDFARQLRQIGPVQPNPTYSQTSTFNSTGAAHPRAPNPRTNPALLVLEARERLQQEAETEGATAGRSGKGRQFLDPYIIRQILVQRDEHGKSAADIERSLDLRPGVVARLGPPGMLGLVTEVGRASRSVDMV